MSHTTYCLNARAETKALTAWPVYAFSRIWRVGDEYYGVRANGIFKVGGFLDDGLPYYAAIRTSKGDMGFNGLKRIAYLRVDADASESDPLEVTVSFDSGADYSTNIHGFTQAKRVKLAQGIRGRYVQIAVRSKFPGFRLRSVDVYAEMFSNRGVK